MKRKMGLFSAVAAGALTLSALGGLTGAAPASAAATWTHLCVDAPAGNGDINVLCIYAPSAVGENATIAGPSASTTNWTYPPLGQIGDIKQANVNLCLQVNESAGGIVRGAKCISDDSSELWTNFYNKSTHRTEFISPWGCLSESPKPLVGVSDCGDNSTVWYLQWGTS